MNWRKVDPYFLSGIGVGVLAIGVYAVWVASHRARPHPRPELWPAAIADTANGTGLTHVYGAASSPYVLRLLSDYQCPGCAAAESTVVPLVKSLADSNAIEFVVYDIAGPNNAIGAVVAATCVGELDPQKYWAYRASLFKQRDQWMKGYPPEPGLIRLASSVGLDSTALRECVERRGTSISNNALELVKTAGRNGIVYTPTWSLQDSVFVTEEVVHRLRTLRR